MKIHNLALITLLALALSACEGPAGPQGDPGANGVSVLWMGEYSSAVVLETALGSPQTNWAYYNTTDKKSYIYDGIAWQTLVQDGAAGAALDITLTPSATAATKEDIIVTVGITAREAAPLVEVKYASGAVLGGGLIGDC
jgi:hypothetical protein